MALKFVVRILKHLSALLIILEILHNYFDASTKLFSNLYSAKFLDQQNRSFYIMFPVHFFDCSFKPPPSTTLFTNFACRLLPTIVRSNRSRSLVAKRNLLVHALRQRRKESCIEGLGNRKRDRMKGCAWRYR